MTTQRIAKDGRFSNLVVDNLLVVRNRMVTNEVSALEFNSNANGTGETGSITLGNINANTLTLSDSLTFLSTSPVNEIVFRNPATNAQIILSCSPITTDPVYTIPDVGTNSIFLLADGVQTINSTKTFQSGIPIAATMNQLVFGSGQTVTVNSIPPAASRTYTIPDTGANSQFVMTDGNQVINGMKTFTTPPVFPSESFPFITLVNANNQLIFGMAQTITVSAPAPAANRIYTIPDTSANSQFVMTDGNQTINGTKTFTSAPVFPAMSFSSLTLTNVSNQLTLGTGQTVVLTA